MTDAARSDIVNSRDEFVLFVRSLLNDLRMNESRWDNRELGTFLEALAAWTEDMDGYYQNRGEPVPREPSWQLLADMLAAARVYE
jgi:hypothetical protein